MKSKTSLKKWVAAAGACFLAISAIVYAQPLPAPGIIAPELEPLKSPAALDLRKEGASNNKKAEQVLLQLPAIPVPKPGGTPGGVTVGQGPLQLPALPVPQSAGAPGNVTVEQAPAKLSPVQIPRLEGAPGNVTVEQTPAKLSPVQTPRLEGAPGNVTVEKGPLRLPAVPIPAPQGAPGTVTLEPTPAKSPVVQMPRSGGAPGIVTMEQGPVTLPAAPAPRLGGAPGIVTMEQEPLRSPAVQIIESSAAPVMGLDAGPAKSPDSGLHVGLGFYAVKPTWESNFAYTSATFVIVGSPPTIQFTRNVDFDYSTALAPRVVVSYADECGLTARVGWWRYDQSARLSFVNAFSNLANTTIIGAGNNPGTTSTFSPVNNFALSAGEFDTLTFRNRLLVDVWDFDVSQRILCDRCWNLTVGAGVRYNYLSQYYDAFSIRSGQQLPRLANTREVHIQNQLSAIGPDLFVEGKCSFGRLGLAFYGNARGGYLFGSGQYNQLSISNIIPVNGFNPRLTNQIDRNVAGLPFVDTEVGIEWQGRGTSRLQPFFRVGAVGQTWFGVGSALTAGGNSNINSNLGFFGGTFLGGVNF